MSGKPPSPKTPRANLRRPPFRVCLSGMLMAAWAGAAWAEPAAPGAESALRVDFGDTALVEQPCPPLPEALAAFLKAPADTPPSIDAVKGYTAYTKFEQANDWAGLCRYREENRRAAAQAPPKVVFMGDSITENWRRYDPGFFPVGFIDRGVSGQTTPQMVVRFYQDVIALHPRVVHIMGGTNDLAGNTGPIGDDTFKNNITAMVDLARANGVAVVLASIPPAEKFSWRPDLKPAAKIVALNQWLAAFARQRGLTFVDYTAALANPAGGLRADLSRDGVHPNKAGYDLMEPLTLKAIAEAEKPRGRSSGSGR